MARYRRKRGRRWARPSLLILGLVVATACVWWLYPRSEAPVQVANALSSSRQPVLTTDRPEVAPDFEPRPGVSEKGDHPQPAAQVLGQVQPQPQRSKALITAGRQASEQDDLVAARAYFSEALAAGAEEPDVTLLRAELTRIGNETIFSPRIFENDPFVERYVIQPGDTLGKIAKANKVSADLLAGINRMTDKNRIRAGQTIKLVKGPFRAVVDKSQYSLDVYVADTFVKHFKVGLGADNSTPTGEWRVGTKLVNPTYYPPRGGQVIAADDPQNPLGERWIGLVGVSGEASGQARYGLHGTIDPQSIGQSISLGCIRMYNEDVEALYTYLIENDSIVAVRD